MNKQTYTSEQRTKAQFRAMYLKQKGYQVTTLKEIDNLGNDIIVAFGYTATQSLTIKPTISKDFSKAKEEDYNFIYWN